MFLFVGYNMVDYFFYWLEFGEEVVVKVKVVGNKFLGIYNVNWFCCDVEGNFVWFGFG